MKVTEHNMDDCDLNVEELNSLLELVKKEIKNIDDRDIQFHYAKIFGKLLGMKHVVDT